MLWNIGQIEELKRRWFINESVEKIAVDMGVCGQTIRTKALALGLPARSSRGRKRRNPDRDVAMAEMRRAGKTYADIAAAFGVSAPCVLYACRRQGVAIKPHTLPHRDRQLSDNH